MLKRSFFVLPYKKFTSNNPHQSGYSYMSVISLELTHVDTYFCISDISYHYLFLIIYLTTPRFGEFHQPLLNSRIFI